MALSMTGIMFITTGIIAIILYHLKKVHLYRAAANFSGPPALPIIGNTLMFLGTTTHILKKVKELTDKYPSPFRVWLGSELTFILYDADHVKKVLLNKNANEKSYHYKVGRSWLGTGLLTATAAKAKIHRKLIEPTFSQRRLNAYVDVFNKQSEILMKQMEKMSGKGEFDICHCVSLCIMDIVCETSMGVSVNAQTGGNYTKFVDSITRMVDILFLRGMRPWLYSDFIFNLTKLGWDQRECLKCLHNTTNDVIHKRQNALKITQGQINTGTTVLEEDLKKKAFLDLMLELSKDEEKLTDKELRDEVNTIMVAANDTTATTASFTLFMLANFPEIQKKVYEELCNVLGEKISSDPTIDIEDLNRMDYLERVVKETLRLFPPAHLLLRTITGDIEIGEQILPKGSFLGVPILTIHRLNKYWPDPFKFDPDRFLPEEVAKRHPYCYIPFSGGARACIAPKYAYMVLKILVAKVVCRYVLIKDKPVRPQDIKLIGSFVIKPAEPLGIRILERQDQTTATNK